MLHPVHQDPADLALSIVAGSLDSTLTVLKQEAFQLGAWTFTFHIIGESHLVVVEQDGIPVFCEVLACADLSAQSFLHQHHFTDRSDHCYVRAGYSVSVNFDASGRGWPEQPNLPAIEVRFPEIAGQTPVTQVAWERTTATRVRWYTLHCYPHAGGALCVRTVSDFDTLHYNQKL